MTDLVNTPRATARAELQRIADTFAGLVQSIGKVRSRLLAVAARDVEWSAHVILKTLRSEGPIRAGALAEAISSDPSTISRQVAGLVKDGLLERQADPIDGRAALLVLTDRAREVLTRHDEVRLDHYAEMLAGWTLDDLARFADLLQRFAEDYENADRHWMNKRAGRDAAPARGHD